MATLRMVIGGDSLLIRSIRFVFVSLLLSSLVMGCAYGRAMDRGDDYYKRGDYTNAVSAYQKALAEKPDSEHASLGILNSRRQIVGDLVVQGTVELENDQVVAALAFWERAAEVPGDHDNRSEFGERLLTRTLELVNVALERGSYAYALHVCEEFAQSSFYEASRFEELSRDLSTQWAIKLGVAADEQLGKGHDAYALLLLAQAVELINDAALRVLRNDLWNRVASSMQYAVAIDVGTNEVPATAFAPLDNESIRMVSADSDSVQVASAIVYMSPLEPRISRSQSTSIWVAEYQSHIRTISNPEYECLEHRYADEMEELRTARTEVRLKQNEVSRRESDLKRARKTEQDESSYKIRRAVSELERAQNTLDSAIRQVDSERNDVQRVADEMNRISSTIELPIYSKYEYPIITHIADGTIYVDIRIEHSDGRATRQVTKTLTLEVRADEHDSHPTIGLAAKYSDMPTNIVLEEQLIQMAVDLGRAEIRQSFDDYREKSLVQAGQIVELDAKIDSLVRYLLMSGQSMHPEVNDIIYESVGIWEPQHVLVRMKR